MREKGEADAAPHFEPHCWAAFLFSFVQPLPNFFQYVTDQPTIVMVNTSINAPTLTMLKVFPCPSR
jgi:hypothetical protein